MCSQHCAGPYKLNNPCQICQASFPKYLQLRDETNKLHTLIVYKLINPTQNKISCWIEKPETSSKQLFGGFLLFFTNKNFIYVFYIKSNSFDVNFFIIFLFLEVWLQLDQIATYLQFTTMICFIIVIGHITKKPLCLHFTNTCLFSSFFKKKGVVTFLIWTTTETINLFWIKLTKD